MKIKEMPGKAIEAITQGLENVMERRQQRMQTPEFKLSVSNIMENMKTDLYNLSKSSLLAAGRLTTAPLLGVYEGFIGSPLKTFAHNSSVTDPKTKKEYPNVLAKSVSETLLQFSKGGLNACETVIHLTKLLGKTTLLGGKYLIGR